MKDFNVPDKWEVAVFNTPHGKDICIKDSSLKNSLGQWKFADRICENFTNVKDAELICAAINACNVINPNNPLAAAEQILNLYEAAKEALSLFDNYPQTYESIGTFEVLGKAVNGALNGYGYFNTNQSTIYKNKKQ